MTRTLFTIVVLGLFGAALAGCRVEGEVDTNSQVPAVSAVR